VTKIYLTLTPSERAVTRCAAEIYSAYIQSGHVVRGDESQWIARSVREAIEIARATDDSLTSDDEMA
jgi:hypothetical protein